MACPGQQWPVVASNLQERPTRVVRALVLYEARVKRHEEERLGRLGRDLSTQGLDHGISRRLRVGWLVEGSRPAVATWPHCPGSQTIMKRGHARNSSDCA